MGRDGPLIHLSGALGQTEGMSVDQVSLALALLACAALFVAALIAVSALLSRFAVAQTWWATLRATLAQVALPLATAIALVTTSGSLYFSEVANFPPCRLCWFQRIFAYPLALIFVVAMVRKRDRSVRPYAIAMCAVGGCISAFHMFVEAFPDLETGSCELDNPCSIKWVDVFGVFTIPTMALCSFVVIATLMIAWPDPAKIAQPAAGEQG